MQSNSKVALCIMFGNKNMMLSAVLLLILGLSCEVYSRNCLHPAALDNFSKKNFEGEWYSMAINTPNRTEEAYYKDTKCSFNSFKLENDNLFSGVVDYLVGDTRIHYTGQFRMRDPAKAKMTVQFSEYPLVYAYDIVCTDYKNWAVSYACSQIKSGHSSEFLSLIGRDRTKHSEITANEDVKKCVQDHLQISIDAFRKTPQENCSYP